MYQISVDGNVLYDSRDDELIVKSPRCKLAVNTIGEASFTILSNHPHYKTMRMLSSVFEIKQDDDVIFRGRMTEDSKDFYNKKFIDLEGVMGYFNDTIVRPFSFPEDFLDNQEYRDAALPGQGAINGGVVRFFLKMLIDNHNSQIQMAYSTGLIGYQSFQTFKLGRVTVSDPNNYITRSESSYKKTWDILKEKLVESSLGGYLCIRYEADGNYIDYLSEFEDDNTQSIVCGENLLDLLIDTDTSETYTAIIPLGADKGNSSKLTIADLEDCYLTGDIVKLGDTIYSEEAVKKYGMIYAPVEETTWEDVTNQETLQQRGIDFITNKAAKVWETLTAKAVDLHLSNKEIEAFRIYKNVFVESIPHGRSEKNKLSEIDIDMENPQNTQITIGETKRVLTDKTNAAIHRVEAIQKENAQTSINLSDKVSKTDDAQIVAMLNRSGGLVEFIDTKIRIASQNLVLQDDGSLVAWNAVTRNDAGSRSVEISDGIINIEGEHESDEVNRTQSILLMRFKPYGDINDEMFGLWCRLVFEADYEWHFDGFFVRKIE